VQPIDGLPGLCFSDVMSVTELSGDRSRKRVIRCKA
jgi:hypothetical protein